MKEFAFYTIPSQTFPKTLTELEKGVLCFKSNTQNELYTQYRNCTGLLIDISKHQDHFEVLCNYIISINLFRQEHVAIQWLAHLRKEECLIKIEDEGLDLFIQDNLYSEDRKWAYDEDYNDLSIHVMANIDAKYSLIDVYQKFSIIEKNSFLDSTLRYLAINHCTISTTRHLYDNALQQNSTLFQIFETILNEFEPINSEQSGFCKSCHRPINPGIKKRILSFLENRGLNKPDISSALIKISETRHKFFHNLKGNSYTHYANEIIKERDDNFISFEDEIKKGEATFLGVGLLKAIVSVILIEELLKTAPNNI